MRRRARIEEKLEKLSVADTLNAIRFAEVVIVLMDAERPFEEQDLRIADLVQREGRALVLGMNKWDLDGAQARRGRQAARRRPTTGCRRSRACRSSRCRACTGDGLDRLMQAVVDALRGLEQARLDQSAQSLVRGRGVVASAARGERPPPQAQLHHAGEGAPAELRAVLLARRRDPGKLSALSGARPARHVRSARHADPHHAAREGQSVRRPEDARQR